MAQQHQQNQSSSRLHRLLTLLDTGSTQATRFAAARQIGDIARTHPEDLNSLLKKVSHYLRSRNWDTRVASAQAIGSIAEKLKLTSFPDLCSFLRAQISSSCPWSGANDNDNILSLLGLSTTRVASLSFRNFDLNKVLDFGALLASGGQEYDVTVDNAKSPRERLAKQKRSLKRRLGLDVCEQFMDVNEMISDEDLVHGFNFAGGHSVGVQGRQVRSFRSKRPSARELNLLKRKAKVNSKDPVTKGWSEEPAVVDGGSNSGMAGTPRGLAPDSSNKFDSASLDDDVTDNDVEGRWPFLGFVEQLLVDMFDPVWEIRHGSIMALREIFTYQGACVGVHSPDSSLSDQMLRDLAVSNIAVIGEATVEGVVQAGGQVMQSNDIQLMNLPVKRETIVDGNVQVAGEEDPQQVLKRQKVNDNYADTSGQREDFSLNSQVIAADQNLGHLDIKPDFSLNSQVIAADQNFGYLDMKLDFSLNSQVIAPVQNLGRLDIKSDFSLNSNVIAADQNLGHLDINPDFSLNSQFIATDQNLGHVDINPGFSLNSQALAADQNLGHTDVKPDFSLNSQLTAVVKNPGHGDIRSEPKLYDSESGTMCSAAETSSFEEVKLSTDQKTDFVIDFSSNHQLSSLVKLTQHSWLRNSEFLLDCAVRFLCVLCLDRFGDYVSDQVVAPVRETCAQALGAVLKYMPPELVSETLNILLQMQNQADWEIRHGSLLGVKYLVAVRREMLSSLLGRVIPACKAGLGDPDDDVRAVAADALIPAASAIVSIKGYTLHSIVMLLWDILLDLDDLSPSTSSVMNLLAEIYSNEDMIPNMLDALAVKEDDQSMPDLNEVSLQDDFLGDFEGTLSEHNPYSLSALAPRLWPFMRHSITSVRHSAIRTLERLLEAGYRRQVSESSIDHGSFWPSSILGDTLRIVFQNLLLESNESILQCTERVWRLLLQCPVKDLEAAASCYISFWLELVTTPYGSSLDASKMFWPVTPSRKSHSRPAAKMRAVRPDGDAFGRSSGTEDSNGYMSSSSVKMVIGSDLDKSVTHTRVVASSALGILASKWPAESIQFIINPLWSNLVSLSGVQRQVASMVIISWFQEMKGSTGTTCEVHPALTDQFKKWMLELLSCTDPCFPTKGSPLPYVELSRTYTKMRSEANQLLHAINSYGIYNDALLCNGFDIDKLSVDEAISFASKIPVLNKDSNSMGGEPLTEDVANEVETLKQRLLTTSGYLKCVQNNLHVAVAALIAAAVVWMSNLPVKLNPIILPLMTSVKREQEEVLQQKAAEALAELIFQCITRKPGPNEKLIKNLCSCTCMDPLETPQAGIINSVETIEEQDLLSFKTMAVSTSQKSRTRSSGGGGEDRSKADGFISRRGAELALNYLCEKFGGFLFDKIPKLWDCLTEVLKPITSGNDAGESDKVNLAVDSVKDPQILINNLQLIRSTAPLLDDKLKLELLSLLPCIFKCVRHPHVAVRLAASRCVASIAKSMIVPVMGVVVENAVPMLGDGASVPARQGSGMLVNLLVQALGGELVPYAPLLVVPLLRCMSDSDPSVRQSVTRSFAALVPLLPLARGLPPPVGLSESLTRDNEDARFLEQLLDSSSIEDYKLCTDLKVTLRRYQQEGVNWLAFLKRFKLHGILCDDMGLGKTLQASAIVASDIAERRQAVDNGREELPPSLIICPSTLVGHWAYEIEKYIDASLIRTLQYVGSTQERISLRSYFDKYNVIITSYDVIRKDVDYFANLLWNYCILDEGHVIKNAKSKITAAVKQLKAQHRLILSGTPIQNNILDLWSLFDFLMPGFLGSERQFQSVYGKPLVAARDAKCSAKDAEAGVLAMEALHKQVMPFLLRRTKAEVLSDLPEKIIQDRFCDLSPVQLKLYEQYSGSHAKQEISGLVKLDDSSTSSEAKGDSQPKATAHVFQALQYLLKLCSHPLLVVGEKVPDSVKRILSELYPESQDAVSELHKLHHSPKLVALQEILEECGVGVDASGSEGGMVSVGQHRVLVFAQHKALLDIIERDLFQTHMKSITYLRLDGSVHPEKRFDIVKTFNSDPTIDVLLLTTHVGGLGLNLTSADTLVFMEHDWNPMRDHQAMDRAHRLGQKRVVNVHRLIMRGTLEEKVMSLQRFKVSVANAVINAENASLKTMNTDQLLDLFTPAENAKKVGARSLQNQDASGHKSSGSGKGLKAILNGLEELWDQSQYTEEYNLDQFLTKLNG